MDNKRNILESEGVLFRPISFGELQIELPNSDYEVKKVDNTRFINSIIFKDHKIDTGERFNINIPTSDGELKLSFKANHIIQDRKNKLKFSILESVTNNATMFILPFIFADKTQSSIMQLNKEKKSVGYLINAYVDSSFLVKKKANSVFLLLKYTTSTRYKQQEEAFRKNKNFIGHKDIDNKYVAYEFEIPDTYSSDVRLLIDGKYSKLKDSSKKKIISFHENSMEGSICNTVLYRDPAIVKQYEQELDVDMTGIEIHKPFNENDILTKNII